MSQDKAPVNPYVYEVRPGKYALAGPHTEAFKGKLFTWKQADEILTELVLTIHGMQDFMLKENYDRSDNNAWG